MNYKDENILINIYSYNSINNKFNLTNSIIKPLLLELDLKLINNFNSWLKEINNLFLEINKNIENDNKEELLTTLNNCIKLIAIKIENFQHLQRLFKKVKKTSLFFNLYDLIFDIFINEIDILICEKSLNLISILCSNSNLFKNLLLKIFFLKKFFYFNIYFFN